MMNVQLITPVPEAITNNVGSWGVFNCPDPIQAERAAKILGQKEMASAIQRLPPRHVILWSEGFEAPILAKTPDMSIGPCPDESTVDRLMSSILAEIHSRLVLSPPFEENSPPICYIEPDEDQAEDSPDQAEPQKPDKPEVIADYTRFLSVVLENKNLSTRELNNALGVSAGKGARLKSQMAANGFITIRKESGPTGRPREIVVVTERGLQFLEQWRHQREI